jgi:hypothetical protein
VRYNKFTSVFRNAERRTVKDSVEASKGRRGTEVSFIEQEYSALFHSHGERAILELHASVFDRQMAYQLGEFETVMTSRFKDRVIQASCDLPDETALASRSRPTQVERIGIIHEKPDDDVPAGVVEDVVGVDDRSVDGRFIEA